MAINQRELLSKSASYQERIYEDTLIKIATAKKRRMAFLCHSHKDEEIVKGLIVIFREAGVELYVDWKDHTMPEITNAVTAKKIQDKIISSNVFLLLATANSKESRWCPWEIGYADAGKKNIYIVPTTDGNNTYGNEYLQLYKKIDVAESTDKIKRGYAVFNPSNNSAEWLSETSLK